MTRNEETGVKVGLGCAVLAGGACAVLNVAAVALVVAVALRYLGWWSP